MNLYRGKHPFLAPTNPKHTNASENTAPAPELLPPLEVTALQTSMPPQGKDEGDNVPQIHVILGFLPLDCLHTRKEMTGVTVTIEAKLQKCLQLIEPEDLIEFHFIKLQVQNTWRNLPPSKTIVKP